MATIMKKQDVPPPGGYKKINYLRNPTYFNGVQMFCGYIGVTAVGLYIYFLTSKEMKMRDVEIRSSRFALQPILVAERDRAYLKELRRLRDEETQLMESVKGWKVGTWFGERIFITKPADELIDPQYKEMYVHTNYRDLAKRTHLEYYA